MLHSTFALSLFTAVASALSASSLKTHVGSLSLSSSFNPIKDAYWTGYPHHRRTPFSVSPDGKSAYLAYLDSSETGVHIQQVDPSTFAAVGDVISVSTGKEAGGLVAHNDGFALLTNEAVTGVTDPVAVLYRYTSGKQSWKTYLGGPDVENSSGHTASPDLNGDLAYSETAKTYGAYFVVTAYDGSASGHFGDTIQYVSDDGTLKNIAGATSNGFGCSHNTGIAFEAADEAPFASICAEDQGNIWLNTETQYMAGVRISNENVTNGASNEAMGGMSGSYSSLARFVDSDEYIFTWVSKGAKDLTTNDWLGAPYTHSINRTANRNVAIARFSDKKTLIGEQATQELGGSGDDQVNWITTGTADHSNAHVAVFDKSNALVTWEEIAEPNCPLVAFGCEGTFTGSYFQLVNNGEKVGEAVKSTNVYVAGDMVTMSDGSICWPYVDMDWSLNAGSRAASVSKISFACMSNGGSSSDSGSSTSTIASSAAAATSTAVAASSKGPATSAAQSSAKASASDAATDVDEVAISTAAPITETSAAAPVASSTAAADDTESALPSLIFESARVSTASVSATGIAPVPTTTDNAAFQSSILIQSSTASGQPTSSVATVSLPASVIDSAAPAPTISSSFDVCAPVSATTVTQEEVVTVTVTPSSAAQPAEPTAPASEAPSSGSPPYPTVSHTGRHHHRPHPTGTFPSGWFPYPSGGFSGRPRPTGGFGGRPSFHAPSGFLTRTKPAPEATGANPVASSAAPAVPVYGSY
ncbi:hypothetical protein DPSP01_012205 [Paraphaeosphaeria sporulosa]|uniref:Uncharacterized protein n=1 Tax=Paraphaeosphaeria sporulosa TaxID=1460663 RepID=A0A177CJ55_9PLEO|nr:uncharacterized protein CC84DRAFT_1175345 [Paraphaeosphaeria sporulosa]OAG07564.1 hypothetical protein CC84DRAFT_1175345 [Paraphaeosphaeria sporulosa]